MELSSPVPTYARVNNGNGKTVPDWWMNGKSYGGTEILRFAQNDK